MALFVGADVVRDNVLTWPGYVCESGNVGFYLKPRAYDGPVNLFDIQNRLRHARNIRKNEPDLLSYSS